MSESGVFTNESLFYVNSGLFYDEVVSTCIHKIKIYVRLVTKPLQKIDSLMTLTFGFIETLIAIIALVKWACVSGSMGLGD